MKQGDAERTSKADEESHKDKLEPTTVTSEATTSEEKLYKCIHCGKRFAEKGSMTLHMNLLHQTVKAGSLTLKAGTSTTKDTKRYSKKDHACLICGRSFSTSSALADHIEDKHKGKPLQCKVCGRNFRDGLGCSVEGHKEAMDKAMTFHCLMCGKIFQNAISLERHRQTAHPGGCRDCGEVFPGGRYKLNLHRQEAHPDVVAGERKARRRREYLAYLENKK